MAQNKTIGVAPKTLTEITAGDVTSIRVQNMSGHSIHLHASASSTPPTINDPENSAPLELMPMKILPADLTLASLWPGVAGAKRVFVYSELGCKVSVSHA